MNADATLFAWVRHYATLLVLCALLGLLGAFAYIQLRPERYEFSTIVVHSGRTIVPRQLAPVARSLFQSSAVYEPVLEDLGGGVEAEEFLRQYTELVPLPEAPGLVILGRSSSRGTAEAISAGMAEQLVNALNDQVGATEFRLFSGPEPSRLPGKLGPRLLLFSGVLAGLCAGVAAALIHYRWRRPVLTLRQALALSGAAHLAILENERKSTWGWLRRLRSRGGAAGRDDVRLAWLARSIGGRAAQVKSLGSMTEATSLRHKLDASQTVGRSGDGSDDEDVLVMVASARTTEDAIVASRLAVGTTEAARHERIALVWLR